MDGHRLSISWRQALSWRLERHLLDPLGEESAGGVVRRLGGLLATDEKSAELAVRARCRTSQPGELAEALSDGSVIKAFAFRGSMHFLSAEDGGHYLTLRAAGKQWERKSWIEYYGLCPQDWPNFRAAVREALSGGPMTLEELGAAVSAHREFRHLQAFFPDGAGTLIKPLCWQGDMVFATPRDGQPTFQRLDTNPHWRPVLDLEDAGRRAILHYLRTYGPATVEHVHYWLGAGLSAGRARLERWWSELRDHLVAIDIEGTTAHVVAGDAADLETAVPTESVRLLPGHDQWVMGVGTKDSSVTPPRLREAVTRKSNLVVHRGVVSGTWSRLGDELNLQWCGESDPPLSLLRQEADRVASFLGADLRLTVT